MKNNPPVAAPYNSRCGLESSPSPQSPPLKGGEAELEQSPALKGREVKEGNVTTFAHSIPLAHTLDRREVKGANIACSMQSTPALEGREMKGTTAARSLDTDPPIEEGKAECFLSSFSLSLEGRGRGEGEKNECQRTKAKKQNLTHFSKDLRKRLTDVERLVWSHLRARQCQGFKFRRQHPIGPYIVDFVCLEKRLIIELDGGHHALPEQTLKDRQRDAWLEKEGYTILHFWDNEVLMNLNGVLEVIRERLIRTPSP
jgi:very-short-patch-repair endonuclease